MLFPFTHIVISLLFVVYVLTGVSHVALVGLFRDGATSLATTSQTSQVASISQIATSSRTIARVPILVYHVVRPQLPTDNAAVRAYAVTPQAFDAQLTHLEVHGYHVIGFHDLESHIASSTPLPDKPIILSFDDGWRNQYTYAFPILKKHTMSATFFVFTNSIGHKNYLSWNNLRELITAGMSVGNHSRYHPFLTKITSGEELMKEIVGSKHLLEQELNISITEFAYPFGVYDSDILTLVRASGYLSARGDVWQGDTHSLDTLYHLSARNAPTTIADFEQTFP